MTGKEHYGAAQELLDVANELAYKQKDVSQTLQWAQVHATLALAAITAALGESDGWMS